MRKLFCILTSCSLLAAGPCVLEEWRLAVGPVVSGDTMYGGVEFEFSNGLDVIVPLGELGDNFVD